MEQLKQPLRRGCEKDKDRRYRTGCTSRRRNVVSHLHVAPDDGQG
jgi:hypothetical protein